MMTQEEIAILLLPETLAAIEANIQRDHLRIALDKHIPHAAIVATQVKYLQRARRKLPSYYEARAIIPPLAFEQSSSEAAAAHKEFSGEVCVDLTCGLGVDSLAFSRKFRQVIAVERNPALAQIARINYSRMGVSNITVVNAGAEDFLENAVREGLKADIVYADPDRRGAKGEKLVRMEDYSPDMIALLPLLKQVTGRVVVKASPLFDVNEAFRLFGPHCHAEAVSLGGECKEVLIESCSEIGSPTLRASAIGIGCAEFTLSEITLDHSAPTPFRPDYRYLTMPDVALRKSRLTTAYFAAILPGAYVVRPDGYVLSDELPGSISNRNISGTLMGKSYSITEMMPYEARSIKKYLAGRGIRQADIYLSNTSLTTQKICSQTGIREGGSTKFAVTETAGQVWFIGLKEIPL